MISNADVPLLSLPSPRPPSPPPLLSRNFFPPLGPLFLPGPVSRKREDDDDKMAFLPSQLSSCPYPNSFFLPSLIPGTHFFLSSSLSLSLFFAFFVP